jgi:hypothetical protein
MTAVQTLGSGEHSGDVAPARRQAARKPTRQQHPQTGRNNTKQAQIGTPESLFQPQALPAQPPAARYSGGLLTLTCFFNGLLLFAASHLGGRPL